ncbi:23S rRNA (uracil(1939)-C(5))-methyltransferase RlmD [Oceanirhabdus seepicola]|uniref:23S rRNA (Uracil(1939)-C(5))-methyltransferase RlmD n=1 Tax=Oceanirhabdus seepicola TaxID=2828781 RepID=A0A9J6NWE8_9CLOT|nr:23S rRNA (uracil(1939)-C(5))-methyltransferase RlmD [Oceanirhabdus seepicola]MCM1988372.1 23S rRNA (uracil(1939)-C(5))-methyltransferase RlmD [Oceanirhabdus seepicola]
MKKRQNYEFTIEDVEFPSHGITYVNGRKVLIKNALKGQKVIGKVTKKNSERIVAKLMEVVEDVDYKIPPVCKPFTVGCGGCAHQDISYEMQLESKEYQVMKLFREAGIDGFEYEGIEGSPDVFEYRNKMEFTFGDMEKGGELTLGMHVKNKSYAICTVDDCQIVDEDFRKVLSTAINYFQDKELPKYRVMQHTGYLRNLVVRKGINTGEILVNIVTTTQLEFDMSEFVKEILAQEYKGAITGIIHTFNDSLSDVVQADSVEVLHGREFIYEELLGLKFKINPFSFFQTNTRGAEKLYSIVRDYIDNTEDKVVFDLYCGTGTIGQIVAPKAKKVVGIELIEEAVKDARENAKLNGLENTEFIAGDIAKVIHTVKDNPDIIILDPPRAGVHPFALKYVLKFNAPQIIYVSCNPKTLVTDLKDLEAGGYKVEKVMLKDMFPHTPHCETVVKLSKK